jgi:murein DD-endopeptidase MepM/ murein hydrolase activator NlpD
MERVLTPDEKLRRAEEIYNRRKNNISSRTSATVSVSNTKGNYLLKKMVLQILISLVIYLIYYLIQNNSFIFSGDVIGKSKEVLSYDINFNGIYSSIMGFIDNKPKEEEKTEQKLEENSVAEEISTENNIQENANVQNEIAEGTLAATEENIYTEDVSSYSQMQIDATAIKEKCSIISPLSGTITSKYGVRNPTTSTVPKYHTGIDIGRNTGTVINAAMEGTVTLVSSEGDYRKSYKNNTG